MTDWVESDGEDDGGFEVGMEMMVSIGLEWVILYGIRGHSS